VGRDVLLPLGRRGKICGWCNYKGITRSSDEVCISFLDTLTSTSKLALKLCICQSSLEISRQSLQACCKAAAGTYPSFPLRRLVSPIVCSRASFQLRHPICGILFQSRWEQPPASLRPVVPFWQGCWPATPLVSSCSPHLAQASPAVHRAFHFHLIPHLKNTRPPWQLFLSRSCKPHAVAHPFPASPSCPKLTMT
jgi:hypothetical protein